MTLTCTYLPPILLKYVLKCNLYAYCRLVTGDSYLQDFLSRGIRMTPLRQIGLTSGYKSHLSLDSSRQIDSQVTTSRQEYKSNQRYTQTIANKLTISTTVATGTGPGNGDNFPPPRVDSAGNCRQMRSKIDSIVRVKNDGFKYRFYKEKNRNEQIRLSLHFFPVIHCINLFRICFIVFVAEKRQDFDLQPIALNHCQHYHI